MALNNVMSSVNLLIYYDDNVRNMTFLGLVCHMIDVINACSGGTGTVCLLWDQGVDDGFVNGLTQASCPKPLIQNKRCTCCR